MDEFVSDVDGIEKWCLISKLNMQSVKYKKEGGNF